MGPYTETPVRGNWGMGAKPGACSRGWTKTEVRPSEPSGYFAREGGRCTILPVH